MRIALVTHYFPAHRGGIERVAAELAQRLVARGDIELTWHASDCDPAPVLGGVTCVSARSCNGIERRFGVPYPLWSPGALLRLARCVRRADAVHLHDCLYLPNAVAFAAARLARRPVLVTQHVAMVPYRNPLLRALLFAAYRVLGRLVLGGASRVVFISAGVREYFQRWLRFRVPALLVPNGVDTGVFHPVDERRRAALRTELGVPAGSTLFIFAGRFVEKKGLPLLRELARELPQARWLFAGWGPLDPALWNLGNVSVLRDLSGGELAALYQAADLLVLPSVGEGFPLVVQEAMACGTPALVGADTAAGAPEAGELILAEDVGGADAAERWLRRLRAVVGDMPALGALRPKVAAFAAANWSWERCAERYAELFAELCKR
ncbi:MAG TPA: glycosyltransferase family 4 protein [Burkholderiales bacterium]|nr:glycosyltransferase family 4 protein [Burkholderiales bacterium]